MIGGIPSVLLSFVAKSPTFSQISPTRKLSEMSAVTPSVEAAAINFFGGLRLPATLIAGTSLGLLFAMSRNDDKQRNAWERASVEIYNVSALLSLCLSILTVLTTTIGSTLLLLGQVSTHAPSTASDAKTYADVYHFLKFHLRAEFVIGRWSFLCSLLCFWVAVTNRVCLEFRLLRKSENQRWRPLAILAGLTGFFCHCLSVVNTTLNCWSNLFQMTKESVWIIWNRAYQRRLPLEMACVGLWSIMVVSTLLSLSNFVRSKILQAATESLQSDSSNPIP